jgi:hypothetical protein
VNLLPYSIFQSLNLGELKPTFVTFLLANRSVKVPRWIVEDVLVQVDKFIYPVDFIAWMLWMKVYLSKYVKLTMKRQ